MPNFKLYILNAVIKLKPLEPAFLHVNESGQTGNSVPSNEKSLIQVFFYAAIFLFLLVLISCSHIPEKTSRDLELQEEPQTISLEETSIVQGNKYYFTSDFKSAQDSYNKALSEYAGKQDKDSRIGEGNVLGNIGLIYLRSEGNLEKAMEYLNKALKIHQDAGHSKGEANQLNNIGIIYRFQKKLDEALYYHQKSVEIHQKIDDKIGIGSNYGNIGLIYFEKGKKDIAIDYLKKAESMFKDNYESRLQLERVREIRSDIEKNARCKK